MSSRSRAATCRNFRHIQKRPRCLSLSVRENARLQRADYEAALADALPLHVEKC